MPPYDLVGRKIDDFNVIEPIGRGGMATVFRAHQESVNRDVALKVIYLHDTIDVNDDFRKRFAQEAEVIASLEHIHILPIYSYGIQDDIAYIAMRLLRGGSLADMIADQTPMTLETAVRWFSQFSSGLAHAHSRGIIHRDLKPSNILLDDDQHAYLTDFGLAKLTTGDANVTATGNIVGTPAYMSPEQLRGEMLDYRSDIYSLGIILYQMFTGKLPFTGGEGSDVIALIYQQLEKEPVKPTKLNPDLPPAVEAVILRAMAKKREDRYSNVGEMAKALWTAVGSSMTTEFPTPASTLRRLASVRRRRVHPYLLTGIILALLVIIVSGVIVLLNRTEVVEVGTVLADREMPIAQLQLTDSEVDLARRQIQQESGFIGVISCNLSSEYHAAQAREIGEFAKQSGLVSRVYDGKNDGYTQLIELERALTEGATAFILCPLDIGLLDEPLRSIQRNKYPLVMPGRPKDESYGAVAIQTDNYQMGLHTATVVGQLIHDELDGKANVVILDFTDIPDPDLVARADGLEAGVLALAPEAKIIGRFRGGTREWAYESIKRLIDQGIHIDAILSINDVGSYGAIDALVEAGYQPDEVMIASVDAEQLARNYIATDHFIRSSIDTGRTQYAEGAVKVIAKLLAGGDVPETIIIPPGTVYIKRNVNDFGQ